MIIEGNLHLAKGHSQRAHALVEHFDCIALKLTNWHNLFYILNVRFWFDQNSWKNQKPSNWICFKTLYRKTRKPNMLQKPLYNVKYCNPTLVPSTTGRVTFTAEGWRSRGCDNSRRSVTTCSSEIHYLCCSAYGILLLTDVLSHSLTSNISQSWQFGRKKTNSGDCSLRAVEGNTFRCYQLQLVKC